MNLNPLRNQEPSFTFQAQLTNPGEGSGGGPPPKHRSGERASGSEASERQERLESEEREKASKIL